MKKIGILTSAVALIAIGAIIALHTSGLVSYNILRYLWPVLIILFGVEILWSRYQYQDTPIRFSGFGILFIIIVFVVSLAQSSFIAEFFNGYSEPVNGHVQVDSSVKRVYIEIPNGKVTVTGTDAQEVTYDGQLDVGASSQSDAEKLFHSEWTERQNGDTLELIFNPPTHIVSFGLGELAHGPYLDVEVPYKLLTSVKTSNGSVNVSAMNADSSIRTSNGSVTIEHVHGNVTVSSSNGAVSFGNITGTLDAHTTNGSIKGESSVLGNWDCTTSNGSIRLDVPQDTNAKIDATTSNGKIGGNVNWQFDEKHHGLATLSRGDKQIQLHTSNGGVTVNLMH